MTPLLYSVSSEKFLRTYDKQCLENNTFIFYFKEPIKFEEVHIYVQSVSIPIQLSTINSVNICRETEATQGKYTFSNCLQNFTVSLIKLLTNNQDNIRICKIFIAKTQNITLNGEKFKLF